MSQLWGGFLLQPMRFLEDLPTRPLTGWLGLGREGERASEVRSLVRSWLAGAMK